MTGRTAKATKKTSTLTMIALLFAMTALTTACASGSSYRWDSENQVGSRAHHEKMQDYIQRHDPGFTMRR